MDENNTVLNAMANPAKRFGRIILPVISIAILPLIFLYVFGFSIKTTPEYECALDTIEKSRQVIAVTGYPLEPGAFAWTRFFESSGMTRQGVFSTSISGPQGSGRMDVNFYRSPVGESLSIWFTSKGHETQVFDGAYPCPE